MEVPARQGLADAQTHHALQGQHQSAARANQWAHGAVDDPTQKPSHPGGWSGSSCRSASSQTPTSAKSNPAIGRDPASSSATT
eukprot:6401806-Prymnesium_polylepis.1